MWDERWERCVTDGCEQESWPEHEEKQSTTPGSMDSCQELVYAFIIDTTTTSTTPEKKKKNIIK